MLVGVLVEASSAFPVLQFSQTLGPDIRDKIHFQFLSSWDELESGAVRDSFDVTIVQTDFPCRDGVRAGQVKLNRLRSTLGPGRMIPLQNTGGSSPLPRFSGALFPIVLRSGRDDSPRSILRALARTRAWSVIRRHIGAQGQNQTPECCEILLRAVVGWPAPNSVVDLAHQSRVSDRTLHRRMEGLRRLTPWRTIRWGRILEGYFLWDMGIRTRSGLATLLGVGDGSTLHRLCEDLAGFSPGEVFCLDGITLLLDAFVSEF